MAQINLKKHADVTVQEALDTRFSVDWSAREFAAGRSWQWTCWRRLYGKK